MNATESWNFLQTELTKIEAMKHAMTVMSFDATTIMPAKGYDAFSKTVSELSGLIYATYADEAFQQAIDVCLEERTEKEEVRLLELLKKDVISTTCMPQAEYVRFVELSSKGEEAWTNARNANDLSLFLPVFEELVAYKKAYANAKGFEQHPYDALLDDFEPGLTSADLDAFFATVKKELVPFIELIGKNKLMQATIKKDINNQGHFPKEKQEEFVTFLASYLGYDFSRGYLGESTHPFSSSLSRNDSRITTNYTESNVVNSIFSVAHETGHASYELGIETKSSNSLIATGTSLGIHESQSRYFENNIGRDKAFWEPIYPALQAFFPFYQNISLEEFILSINTVNPSLIRVDADEVTYPLHIMVRYDIEKGLIDGTIDAKDIEHIWNEKMEEYLGVIPTELKNGALQDIHWSDGSFGYFPTYALGSSNAAQIAHTIERELDVRELLADRNLLPIRQFLGENIWQYGAVKTPEEIMVGTTGEATNAKYYTDYLIKKYSTLFGM